MFEWTNKIDNVDDILADDINSIAQEVIALGKNDKDITQKLSNKQDIFIVNAKTSGDTFIVDKTYNKILEAIQRNNDIIVILDDCLTMTPSRTWRAMYNDVEAITIVIPSEIGVSKIIVHQDNSIIVEELDYEGSELRQDLDNLWDNVGYLDGINTNDKSNVVNAVNEVNNKVGDNEELKTLYKTNIVTAINELVGYIDIFDKELGDIDIALENIIAMQNSYIGGDSV